MFSEHNRHGHEDEKEKSWNEYANSNVSAALENIKKSGDLSEEDMPKIKKAAEDFNKIFNT